MECDISKIKIGTVLQLELKTKSPITFGYFTGGTVEHGLTYTGKLIERRWLNSKNDYILTFLDSDGTSTHFFEGAINRGYNILGCW